MSQLTEISIVTKKIAFWALMAFIGYILLKFMLNIGIVYWKNTHPIPLDPPKEEFGKLPNPNFSHIATSSSGLKFKLENVEGLPIKDATPSGKVYSMPQKLPTLLDSQKARDFAAKMGFTDKEEPLSSTSYRFVDPSDKLRTLEIDILNKVFKLKLDYKNSPDIFSETIQNKDQAISEVKNYIQLNSLFDDSVLKGKIATALFAFDPQTKNLIPAASLSSTNILKINFGRLDLDGKKVLPPAFNESYNYVLYTPSLNAKKRIVEINYAFWPISTDNFGTYPLRTSETAWQDLTDGYAIVVNLGNNSADQTINIRNIYLAFYDSEEPQNYLQPIYVFEGDNDFIAYLPAVSSEWLE